jgi:hypothetical protein
VNEIMQSSASIDGELSRLRALESDALRRELADSLAGTAHHLLRLAAIVRILEERGEDLTELRIGMLGHLRRIAYGQVLPETVVRFAEYPLLLQRVGQLPIPEQRRLADGESITIAVRREDGTFDHREADPLAMTPQQIHQVFSRGSIRGLGQQILTLEDRPARAKAAAVKSDCRADRERGGIVVGRKFVPLAEALAAIADTRGTPIEGETGDATPLQLRLSESEHHRMKIRAAQSRCTMTDLIRRALYAAGLMDQPTQED